MSKEFYEDVWKEHLKTDDSELWSKFDLQVVKIIKPFLKNSCLDVGCGNGFVTKELAKFGHVEGMDISAIAIEDAKKKYPNIPFKQGSVTKMPYPNDSFSCLFVGGTVEHILETDAMFSEFHRVLKSGGNLIITTPEFNWLKRVLVAMFKWDEFFDPSWEHVRFYSFNSLKKTLEKHCFEVIHKESTGGFLPSSMVVVARCRK